MKFHGMSPTEIVTYVYSHFAPRPMWSGESNALGDIEIRRYCPHCQSHKALRERDKPKIIDKVEHWWYCAACEQDIKRPAMLKAKGSVAGKESAPAGRDNDWRIVDGMQAGKVISAVESLPLAPRMWAIYAYTDQHRDYLEPLLKQVYAELQNRSKIPRSWQGDWQKHIQTFRLVTHVVYNVAHNKPVSNESMARSVGLGSPNNFVPSTNWGKFNTTLRQILDDWDQEIGEVVIDAVKATREVA